MKSKINPESEVLVEVTKYLLSGLNTYIAGKQFSGKFKDLPEDIQLEVTEGASTVKVLSCTEPKEETEPEEKTPVTKIKKVKKVKKSKVSE